MQSKDLRLATERDLENSIGAATAPLDQRLEDLEVSAGFTPGDINDTTTASLIRNQESDTHSELSAAIVEGAADPGGYDVILLAGQSNMHGRGTPFSATTDPEHPLIKQWLNGNTVASAIEPLGNTGANGIGPGFQFARWYVAEGLNRGRKVLLINAAQGGTPITRDAAPTWKPSIAGSLYDRAISWTNAALALPGSKLAAVLWLQGETDGDLAATEADYRTQLDALIGGFRAGISGATNVPFIIGGMVPDYLTTGTRYEINAVHKDTPNRIPYVGFAASPAGPSNHLGDGNHFNAAGQRKVAKSMFDVFQRIRVGLAVDAALSGKAAGVDAQPSRAYSLRRAVEGYYGPAVKVRRSSDGATKNIGLTSGGDLDQAVLLAFASGGDAFVETVYDQSGNAGHLTQATTAAQPKIVTAGVVNKVNARPVMTFDGTDDVLVGASANLYAAGSLTIAGVLRGTATAASRWLTEGNANSSVQYGLMQSDRGANGEASPIITDNMGQWLGGSLFEGASSTVPRGSNLTTFSDGAMHQLFATDSGSTMSQYLDGAADLSLAYTRRTTLTANNLALGGIVRSGSLAPLPMSFAEVIVWTSVLSSADRVVVQDNQKAFYGTP